MSQFNCRKVLYLIAILALNYSAFAMATDYETGMKAWHDGNHETAVGVLTPLAEQVNACAQYWLGEAFSFGKGVPEDNKTSERWMRRAAKQGIAEAQWKLGYGLLKDYHQIRPNEAKIWLERAADQGWAPSMSMLADNATNDTEAVQWYRRAIDAGDDSAAFELAEKYEKGIGVELDPKEATRWYRYAAERGTRRAMLALSRAYMHGNGVEQDDIQAWGWRKAADIGAPDILIYEEDKILVNRMTENQRADGWALAHRLHESVSASEGERPRWARLATCMTD